MENRTIDLLPMVRRMGRTTIQGGKLYLFWTASGIDFCFRGERISVVFTAGFTSMEQWISMELDGFFLLRMPLHRGENRIDLLQGLDAGVMHRIRLFREVQMIPDDNACFLTLDCLQYEGEITAPPEASLTIEFVGDSITSGEGSCGAQMEEDWISPYFGVENNYARMTADILNARFSCISQSGWGIVSDYQNNPHRVLPRFYEQICGVTCCRENILAHAHDPFDFSADPSDIVVVNLGTNDDGAFHAEPYFDPETMSVFCQQLDEFGRPQMKDAERLQGAVVAFLQKIRRYNPQGTIRMRRSSGAMGCWETSCPMKSPVPCAYTAQNQAIQTPIFCFCLLQNRVCSVPDSIPGALRIRQPHRFCHRISGSCGDNRPAATRICCRFLFTVRFLLRFTFFYSSLSLFFFSVFLPSPALIIPGACRYPLFSLSSVSPGSSATPGGTFLWIRNAFRNAAASSWSASR